MSGGALRREALDRHVVVRMVEDAMDSRGGHRRRAGFTRGACWRASGRSSSRIAIADVHDEARGVVAASTQSAVARPDLQAAGHVLARSGS